MKTRLLTHGSLVLSLLLTQLSYADCGDSKETPDRVTSHTTGDVVRAGFPLLLE